MVGCGRLVEVIVVNESSSAFHSGGRGLPRVTDLSPSFAVLKGEGDVGPEADQWGKCRRMAPCSDGSRFKRSPASSLRYSLFYHRSLQFAWQEIGTDFLAIDQSNFASIKISLNRWLFRFRRSQTNTNINSLLIRAFGLKYIAMIALIMSKICQMAAYKYEDRRTDRWIDG